MRWGSTTTYDEDGNVTSVTNPEGETTAFTYDDRDNPAAVADATGASTRKPSTDVDLADLVSEECAFDEGFVQPGTSRIITAFPS